VQPKTRLHSFYIGMMANKGQRIQDLLGLIHSLYDPGLAEDWDNVGLQVGDLTAPLMRVMVALDPSLPAVRAACDAEAQALVTHHPLLFRSIKRLTPDDAVGKVLWQAVQSGVAVISAHTNLDCDERGLNSWLAGQPVNTSNWWCLSQLVTKHRLQRPFLPVVQARSEPTINVLSAPGEKEPSVPLSNRTHLSVNRASWNRLRKFASRRSFHSANCHGLWRRC